MKNIGLGLVLIVLSTLGDNSYAYSRDAVMRMVVAAAREAGIDPALALAVAHTESSFRPLALSHAGARGVMQMMPATARGEFGARPAQLWDPRINTRLGSRFLRQLLDRYGRTDIALSHYNGGSAVRRANGTLRVIPATRGYVRKVIALAGNYRNHPLLSPAGRKLADFRSSASHWNHRNNLETPRAVARMEPQAERAALTRSLQRMRSGMARLGRAIPGGTANPTPVQGAMVRPLPARALSRRTQVLQWESIYP